MLGFDDRKGTDIKAEVSCCQNTNRDVLEQDLPYNYFWSPVYTVCGGGYCSTIYV